MTEPDAALNAMLAEYESLRTESQQAIQNRVSVTNFTFGALAVVIAGLLSSNVSEVLAGIVGMVFVPQIAKAGLLIWLGEYNRSQRAGRWIADLEKRMNELVQHDAVGWERRLQAQRGSSGHMSYPYVANAVITIGMGWAGGVVGAVFLFDEIADATCATATGLSVAGICLAFALVEWWFLRYFARHWREAREG
ncbi:MAG TPA: hypothetical protein VHF89_16345 [Solirubrobacteraceae bacterium]|nr:hypothetical protein [Solirubrobacteraceae bacterium]